MAKYDHSTGYAWKFEEDVFTIRFDYTNNIAEGDSLTSCSISITDVDATEQEDMVDNITVSSPYVYFDIQGGTADNTYSIKLQAETNGSKTLIGLVTLEVFGSITLNTKLGDKDHNSYATLSYANQYVRNKYGHKNAFDTLSLEGKKRSLIEAAKDMESFYYIRKKYYDSQGLAFPLDNHEKITGACGTPLSSTGFTNTSLYSSVYGKYPTNYWSNGCVHMTSATLVSQTRRISTSNSTTGAITVASAFTATPTANTDFIVFAPIDNKIKDAQIEQALHNISNVGDSTLINYKNLGAESVRIGDVRVEFGKNSGSGLETSISPITRKLLSKWIKKNVRIGRA